MLLGRLALFAGGVLFGTAGVSALKSEEAKKVYVQATALGLRCKDALVKTGVELKENFDDVCAEAADINDARQVKINEKKLEEARALLAEAEARLAEAEAAAAESEKEAETVKDEETK